MAIAPPVPPHPPNLDAIAQLICAAENLTLVRRAGHGTFKETFEVQSTAGPVALKIYRPGHSPDRPVREIDAMMRCNHQNIARLIKVATLTSGASIYPYCLEEFIPGGTLTARLAGALYTRDDLETLAMPLLHAVAHVAGFNLVHRDIKPDNVLLRADGTTPVVVDFGLVRDLTAVSITPTWAPRGPGTPLYAPPEQLLNSKGFIDWRSDQFSLGVLLSYAIFGYHPYEQPGDTPRHVVGRVGNREDVSQRFKDAAAQHRLSALVTMTARWPYERFRKPADLINAWRTQTGAP